MTTTHPAPTSLPARADAPPRALVHTEAQPAATPADAATNRAAKPPLAGLVAHMQQAERLDAEQQRRAEQAALQARLRFD